MTISFAHRHVLEEHITGFETKANPHHLSVPRRPAIITVLARAGAEEDVQLALGLIEEASLRTCGPAEWLVVSHTLASDSLLRQIRALPGACAFDHSDGRVLMKIGGPHVRRILAKCVAVDLHPDAFAIDACANMLVAHVAGNLARTGADTFEIIVPRSYAGTVFEELKEMGREFALTAGFE
jgi:sarcosine oxidase subunit gamma